MGNRNRNRGNQYGSQQRGQQHWQENQRQGMGGYGTQDWGAGSIATGSMYGQSGRTGTQGGYSHEHEDRPSEYGSMGYGQSQYGQHRMEREGYGQTGYGQSNRGYSDYSGQYPMQGRYSEPYRSESQYYNQGGGDYRNRDQGYSGQYGSRADTGFESRPQRRSDLDDYENDYNGRPIRGAYSTDQPRQYSGNSGVNTGSWRSNPDAWNGGSYELQRNQRGKAPKNYKKSDDRIRDDVSERLIDDGYDCSDVEVNCSEGIVTLSGECCSRDTKHGMERSASDVHGVKDVNNQMRLKDRQRSDDSGSKNWSSAESSGASLSSTGRSSDWSEKSKK